MFELRIALNYKNKSLVKDKFKLKDENESKIFNL